MYAGTGKSFIGTLLAKAFHDQTDEKIVVICSTNHALDQFLKNLLDIGIPPSAITRLGFGSNDKIRSLDISEQKSSYRRSRGLWEYIDKLEKEGLNHGRNMALAFDVYQHLTDAGNVMRYLESQDPEFWKAFEVPRDENGSTIGEYYLYDRWIENRDAGIYARALSAAQRKIWEMNGDARDAKMQSSTHALASEQTETIQVHAAQIDQRYEKLKAAWGDNNRNIMKSKRIIGCTITAATMCSQDLQAIAPGITLMDKAEKMLESHVLTALPRETKHLVLIGDHSQLRPNIHNYDLSIDKGDGYELNVSLFERLISTGYPYTALRKQHRMCPEISALVRNLAYPVLKDDMKTKNRSPPRGLQDRVIFMHHENTETIFADARDNCEQGAKQSKRNVHEAAMISQIVKYLAQQGYERDQMLILTPYLGQLHLLQNLLSKQNDPVLNDLDSHALSKTGLSTHTAAPCSKKKIRLSTIGT